MRMVRNTWKSCWLVVFGLSAAAAWGAEAALPTVVQRFADESVSEEPSFQRHVVPLLGRLGCNGRACHGSFQGRGGFRLSLFGYDFKADHTALLDEESPRVDREKPLESLILNKPTSEDEHEGGLRYEKGGWEYHVLRRWVEAGAKFEEDSVEKLAALEVTPSEIIFRGKGEQVQLQVVAVWADGSREDVTPLCRFQTNDNQIASIDQNGLIVGTDAGDTHVVVFYDKAVIPVPVMRPVSELVGDKYPEVETPTRVDELVVRKLRKVGLVPSDLCSDTEFLRRVSLDLAGTLPTAAEVEAFLADTSPDKRARKIDQLLETPGYAAWWATKLCDFTGNNDDETVNVTPGRGQAGKDWYQWINHRLQKNVPYDELAAGIVLAVSRDPEESYYEFCKEMSEIYQPDSKLNFAEREYMPYYWARRNFRQPPERAISFAYTFLGVRIECAQCHKHPFDQWSKNDFEEFSKFFAGITASNRNGPGGNDDYQKIMDELKLGDARGGQQRNAIVQALRDGKVVPFPEVYVNTRAGVVNNRNRRGGEIPANNARLLGQEPIDLGKIEDSRKPLMDWLRDPSNPYFAKAFVNRVWATYFGVGIVQPPDDMSLANPPSNAALLDYLARGFIENNFDMKWVHREILNSRTYQLSWRPNETNESDKRNFARAYIRRLPAEVIVDAIRQATSADSEVTELVSNMEGRAISTPGSGIRNQNGQSAYALSVFGRSTRESNCDCDRSTDPSLLQTVYLQNDQDVLKLLERPRDGWIAQLSQEIQPQPAGSGSDSAAAERLLRQIEQANAQRERLESRGDKKQLAALDKRLEQLQSQLEKVQPKVEQVNTPSSVDRALLEKLVQQTYLRSLSRYATPEESARALQHVQESATPVGGFRDLLWALVNTKEFIVNH
jgi:hypothetical protein